MKRFLLLVADEIECQIVITDCLWIGRIVHVGTYSWQFSDTTGMTQWKATEEQSSRSLESSDISRGAK